jgi:hypothetical protein
VPGSPGYCDDPAYFVVLLFLNNALPAGEQRDVGFLIEIVEPKAQAPLASAVMFLTDTAFTSRCTTEQKQQ